MKLNEDKEVNVKLAPHTLETLEEAGREKRIEMGTMIRLILNEWALKYEQFKNRR